MLSKFIHFVKNYQGDIILFVAVVLISLLSFAMGYITAKQEEKEPIEFEYNNLSRGNYCLLRPESLIKISTAALVNLGASNIY